MPADLIKVNFSFSLKNTKKGDQLLLLTCFKCTLFYKSVPDFRPSKPKRIKGLDFFTPQVGAEAKLFHP